MQYEYEIIRHSNHALFNLFVAEINSRSIHYHSDFELSMVLQPGELEMICKEQLYSFKKGDMFIMNPLDPHGVPPITSGDNLLLLVLHISPKLFREAFPDQYDLRFMTFELDTLPEKDRAETAALFLRFASAYFSEKSKRTRSPWEDDPFDYLGLFYMLMHKLLRVKKYSFFSASESVRRKQLSDRLSRITKYIDENYMYKVSLNSLAKEEGVSQGYLSHFIAKYFGCSFQEYVTIIRLDHAKKLMLDGMRIAEASIESGFSDPRYLIKAFAKYNECTPAQFIDQNKGSSMPAANPSHDNNVFVNSERIYSPEESLRLLESVPGDLP